MTEKSVSEAVRELEELLEEGFLSETQFRREVRELLERMEPSASAGGALPRPPAKDLGDMVRHSSPVDSLPDPPLELEPTPELFERPEPLDGFDIAGSSEPAAPSARPAAPSARPAAPSAPPVEPGRVIVSGKTPWDDKGHSRVTLGAKVEPREDADEDRPIHGSERRPLNPIVREKLARMAERTNEVINKPKREDVAFFLSFVLPGLGHAYYGDIGTGMGLMFLGGACWVGVFLQEWWVLYILGPMCLLAGALAHRTVKQRNRYLDLRTKADERRAPKESSLNVEKSIRQAGAKPPTRHR